MHKSKREREREKRKGRQFPARSTFCIVLLANVNSPKMISKIEIRISGNCVANVIQNV